MIIMLAAGCYLQDACDSEQRWQQQHAEDNAALGAATTPELATLAFEGLHAEVVVFAQVLNKALYDVAGPFCDISSFKAPVLRTLEETASASRCSGHDTPPLALRQDVLQQTAASSSDRAWLANFSLKRPAELLKMLRDRTALVAAAVTAVPAASGPQTAVAAVPAAVSQHGLRHLPHLGQFS
jgi:hypothetical protein